MTHELSIDELTTIEGGAYEYLEQQFGVLVGFAFMAGAVGSPLLLGGAFAVGGLMLVDAFYNG
jgi:bacteriocin-like protein